MVRIPTIPKYFATFNEHVSRLIPESAKRILDVGCGAGLFLKKLKGETALINCGRRRADPIAALAAKDHLDSITHGTMPDVANIFTDDTYDAIIYLITEHLVHPINC